MRKKSKLDGKQIEAVDTKMAEILKKKTPAERLEIAFGLWRSTAKFLFFCVKSLHPDWDRKRIEREVVRRLSRGAI